MKLYDVSSDITKIYADPHRKFCGAPVYSSTYDLYTKHTSRVPSIGEGKQQMGPEGPPVS